MNAREIARIYYALMEELKDVAPLLQFADCYQLLISVILSAQTTDAQVNEVTPLLFERFPEPVNLAGANLAEVESIVHSTGFYRTKARNIRNTARRLLEDFDGAVPGTIDELLTLPGVGRKSANVVLGYCFGEPAIIVDTHFGRVVRRLGLTEESDPTRVESVLKDVIPSEIQYHFSMLINRHGRVTCGARLPRCTECVLYDLCDRRGVGE